jgi:hypothetical protein
MEHVIVFFVAGFIQFMYVSGAKGPASVLFFVLLVGSVYLAGWLALITVLLGMVFGNVLARSR